jgi:hypothetical protein
MPAPSGQIPPPGPLRHLYPEADTALRDRLDPLLVGGVLVGTLTANAPTSSTQSAAAAGSASTQESRATFPAHGTPAHENLEKPVTGAAADKARAVASGADLS